VLAFARGQLDPIVAPLVDVAVMQGGLLFGWITTGLLPLARAISSAEPISTRSSPGFRLREFTILRRPELALSTAAPVLAILMSEFWQLGRFPWGGIELIVAVGYAYASLYLNGREARQLSSALGLAAVVLGAMAVLTMFSGETVSVSIISAEALLVMFWAGRVSNSVLRIAGHILFVLCGMAVADIILGEGILPPLVNTESLAALAVIAIFFAASYLVSHRSQADLYRLASLVGLLLWFLRDLSEVDNGQALVSMAWGLTAIALIVAGLMLRAEGVRRVGVATLLIVVVKLFVVDLAALDAIWRIILFLGLGAVLLLASYLFPAFFRGPLASETSESDGTSSERMPHDG